MALARLSADRKWPLFRMRPKVHVYPHVPTLSWIWQGFQFCLEVSVTLVPTVFLPHITHPTRRAMEDQLNTGSQLILNPHCALIQFRQILGNLPQNLITT